MRHIYFGKFLLSVSQRCHYLQSQLLSQEAETHFKCMGVQGNDEASSLSEETYPVSCDDGGISSSKNTATVQIYSDN